MDSVCFICRKSDQNELEYGEFLTKGKLSVHYFCLLFSNDLQQDCKTEQGGIRRFKIRDICKLYQETRSCRCIYCHKGNATVRCGQPGCLKTFHFICGMRADSLPQFCNTFPMYCSAHLPAELLQPGNYGTNPAQSTCAVCTEALPVAYSLTKTIESCCQRGWFHTGCMRQFSSSAGYYMGCLMCRQTMQYREHIKRLGVYVPDREAHWEHKSNKNILALKWRHSRCDVFECHNPLGRDSRSLTGGPWTLWLCNICAAGGAHAQCVRDSPNHLPVALQSANKYMCPMCRETLCRRPVERMQRTLADETFAVDDDEEDLLNWAQYAGSSNHSSDCDIKMVDEDAAVEVITISSDSYRTSSLQPSDSNSCMAEQSSALSGQKSELTPWLTYLESIESARARRVWRLRLLLGQEMPMDHRVRM